MTETPSEAQPKPKRRWLTVALALVLLVAVVLLLSETEDTADVTRSEPPPPRIVTVIEVAPAVAVATVTAFAELRPRWDAEIRSGVSGRITKVHAAALAGERVEADAPLFSIEKTRYQTAVADAELGLEEAKLAHWQARNKVTVARRMFERDGEKPPNDLALHLPELRIAERRITSAKAQLAAARRELADTEVTAPFSGFVTKRMANLGQTIAAGGALVHLSDDRVLELVAELSAADRQLLSHPIAGTTATLTHRDGTALGEARVRQGGGFLDPKTRQPRIFLEVTEPGPALLAGDFVRVSFAGRPIADTLTLPESTLTRAGYIWMIDADDLLARIKADILFRTDGKLVIAAPEGDGPWRIAKTPLASFLPGQRVSPRHAGD